MKKASLWLLKHRRGIDLLMVAMSLLFTLATFGSDDQIWWIAATALGLILYLVDLPGMVYQRIVRRQLK